MACGCESAGRVEIAMIEATTPTEVAARKRRLMVTPSTIEAKANVAVKHKRQQYQFSARLTVIPARRPLQQLPALSTVCLALGGWEPLLIATFYLRPSLSLATTKVCPQHLCCETIASQALSTGPFRFLRKTRNGLCRPSMCSLECPNHHSRCKRPNHSPRSNSHDRKCGCRCRTSKSRGRSRRNERG